ncbi:DUF4832 domain-containing protein [Balneolales bacterium ANBcel1]|nr:DUF4832 domain-containing protein [Balneolales bacterium ANBcel1]
MFGITSEHFSSNSSLVTYSPTDSNFPNPERGFYNWSQAGPSSSPLVATNLASMRSEGKSLLYRAYFLGDFRDSDISQGFLDLMEADFHAAREAGIKLVLRFRYTTSMDDPDAPADRVLAHIEQLQPLFEENYDVIAVVNAGFIGAWGEWHASHHNLTSLENKKKILGKLLEVIPEDRFVQIRYPMDKMSIYGTTSAVGPGEAFDGSDKSRTGHHNDCFLASPNDVGTYTNPTWEKNYLHDDTRYLPMGGETCRLREDAGTRYYCNSALDELAYLRWSFMNSSYYRGILDTWTDQGCMPDVERRLGYRFVMNEGSYSEAMHPGGALRFEMTLTNEGFAAPFNPRDLKVILRDPINPDELWEVQLPEDPRFWLGGEMITISHDLGISSEMENGNYDMLLHLPDPAERLQQRPEYAIRLANENVWEENTGFNRLLHQVTIDDSAEGTPHDGELVFRQAGTVTSSYSDNRNIDESPYHFRLHHNYPNPFNPATTISYELDYEMEVRLDVFSLSGHHISTLVNTTKSAGLHTVTFDAENLASGVYLYRFTSGNRQLTRSMSLIK